MPDIAAFISQDEVRALAASSSGDRQAVEQALITKYSIPQSHAERATKFLFSSTSSST